MVESHFEDDSRHRAESQVLIGDLEAVVDGQLLKRSGTDAPMRQLRNDASSGDFGSFTEQDPRGRARSKSTHSSKTEIME